ncbi:MAG TPA: hypothetical protein VGX28_13425 [Frankiaceae bacterium]|nr:hypothetical protein [Frankiaceae bacterium]
MRIRLLSVAAVAVLAAALPAGAAAPKPQITDPAGDARTQAAGADIVSVLFGTTGTTTKVGRKSVYTPSKLVVDVTYSAAPSTDPYVSHQVTFTAPGCGNVYLEIYSGGTFGVADCLPEDTSFDVSYKAAGNVLSISLPFNTIGKQYFKVGSSLTDLAAYTALADPVLGYESQELAGIAEADGSIDYATSPATFKI